MVRQYIGARYTTKIYENSLDHSSAEWESGVIYEPLTLVTYNSSSYISKKNVPATVGNPAANADYWTLTGAYNGQILQLQNQINDINAINFVAASSFSGADDTAVLQAALDASAAVLMDRDFNIGTVNITHPVKLNLGGNTLTATTNEDNAINIISGNVEIFNGIIDTTVDNPDNADNYGACIYLQNKPAYINPPIVDNIKLHDLKTITNGAIAIALCGEVRNSEVYNIEFDGSNGANTNVNAGLNLEWHGDHNICTYHPHNISVRNIYFHDYITTNAVGIRNSGVFNVVFENIRGKNANYGIIMYAGDYAGSAAPADYQDFVNTGIVIRNYVSYDVKVPVRFTGDANFSTSRISALIEGLRGECTSPDSTYQGIRGVYTKDTVIRDCILDNFNNGISLTSENNGLIVENSTFKNMKTFGMNIVGDSVQIKGNKVFNTNTDEATGTGTNTSSINLSGKYGKIIGNELALGTSEHAVNAVRIVSGSDDIIFVDNVINAGKVLNITTYIDDNNIDLTTP